MDNDIDWIGVHSVCWGKESHEVLSSSSIQRTKYNYNIYIFYFILNPPPRVSIYKYCNCYIIGSHFIFKITRTVSKTPAPWSAANFLLNKLALNDLRRWCSKALHGRCISPPLLLSMAFPSELFFLFLCPAETTFVLFMAERQQPFIPWRLLSPSNTVMMCVTWPTIIPTHTLLWRYILLADGGILCTIAFVKQRPQSQ